MAASVFLPSVFLFLFSINLAFAAEEPQKINYVYPWTGATTPAGFVSKLYQVSLGLAAASALGVIIFGGIMWSLSEAVTKKEEARSWIAGGIWGLVLLLSAYLILNTINPDLVQIGKTQDFLDRIIKPVPPPTKSSAGLGPSSGLPTVPSPKILKEMGYVEYSHNDAAAILAQNQIAITSTNGCFGKNEAGCTDLNGMNNIAINKLVLLKTKAGFSSGQLIINGANESVGHSTYSTHGGGSTFDISIKPNGADAKIQQYVGQNNVKVQNTSLGQKYTMKDGSVFLRENNHWHVYFSEKY